MKVQSEEKFNEESGKNETWYRVFDEEDGVERFEQYRDSYFRKQQARRGVYRKHCLRAAAELVALGCCEGSPRLEALLGAASDDGTVLLMSEPPEIDAGEITDKGYINQRAVQERRADLVERLYAESSDPEVILL